MFKETISPEEINELPLPNFDSEVVVIEDDNQAEAEAYLATQTVIGFDTESRAAFKKGVQNEISLVQLAGETKTFLIRVNKTHLSKGIVRILQSKSILKIGAAIKDDIHQMQSISPFRPKGFVDLQCIVKEYGIRELSLKKMSAIVLGMKISKAQRLSNWSAQSLTPAQTKYAAIDAWVCREIYLKLMKSEKNPIIKENNEPSKSNSETQER